MYYTYMYVHISHTSTQTAILVQTLAMYSHGESLRRLVPMTFLLDSMMFVSPGYPVVISGAS